MADIDDELLAECREENARLRELCEDSAEVFAELGYIPNTPAGRRGWIEGIIIAQRISI